MATKKFIFSTSAFPRCARVLAESESVIDLIIILFRREEILIFFFFLVKKERKVVKRSALRERWKLVFLIVIDVFILFCRFFVIGFFLLCTDEMQLFLINACKHVHQIGVIDIHIKLLKIHSVVNEDDMLYIVKG